MRKVRRVRVGHELLVSGNFRRQVFEWCVHFGKVQTKLHVMTKLVNENDIRTGILQASKFHERDDAVARGNAYIALEVGFVRILDRSNRIQRPVGKVVTNGRVGSKSFLCEINEILRFGQVNLKDLLNRGKDARVVSEHLTAKGKDQNALGILWYALFNGACVSRAGRNGVFCILFAVRPRCPAR